MSFSFGKEILDTILEKIFCGEGECIGFFLREDVWEERREENGSVRWVERRKVAFFFVNLRRRLNF